jgi:hypothetical protein
MRSGMGLPLGTVDGGNSLENFLLQPCPLVQTYHRQVQLSAIVHPPPLDLQYSSLLDQSQKVEVVVLFAPNLMM